MASHHLLIKEVSGNNMTALTNFYSSGMPALTCFAGYVDYIKRTLNEFIETDLCNISFMVFIHDHMLYDGNKRGVISRAYEGGFSGAYKSRYKDYLTTGNGKTLQDHIRCRMKFSFIINFNLPDDDTFGTDEIEGLHSNLRKITNRIHTANLCGGKTEKVKSVEMFSDKKSVFESMLRSSPSVVIASSNDLFEDFMQLFDDPLKAVMYACESYERIDGKIISNQKGIVRPTNIGYLEITEPVTGLPGSRNLEVPVAYSDCITGLIKLEYGHRVVRKILSGDDEEEKRCTFNSVYDSGLYQVLPLN